MSWFAWLLVAGETEAEALENIRDAIEAYLLVVNEMIKDAHVREVDVAA